MKIREKIGAVASCLAAAGIAEERLEAEFILSLVLSRGRDFLYAYPEIELTARQESRIEKIVKRRKQGFSLAVISGHKEFYGLDFLVDKNVLVPRPETELMVDEAFLAIGNYKIPNINLIDVGTGSGCIIISLAKKLKEAGIFGGFYGLDISKKALAIARKNAGKNDLGSCIKFLHSDLLKVIDFKKINGPIFVTANLPYLTEQQFKESSTIKKEPKKALVSGVDGLSHYRRLFKQIKSRLLKINGGLTIFCEIDESQAATFAVLIEGCFPEALIEVKKDLGGFDRLISARIK